MKDSPVRKIFPRFKAFVAGLAAVCTALALTGCGSGGGGGDEDDSPPTIRPKTLDGLILNMDGGARFEFIRNTGSPGAVSNGDVETGTFFYTGLLGSNILKTYDNLGGDKSNFMYPLSVTAASYTYRAVNDSSGVLTLTANGHFDLLVYLPPRGGAANDSWIRLFNGFSPGFPPADVLTHVAEVGLTFTSNGAFVTTDTVTLRLPESPVASTYDTVRIPTNISLSPLGPVPVNYNPPIDPNRPSRIAPASLGKRLIQSTNGIPDPTKDFSIQFAADAVVPGTGNGNGEITEVGRGLLYVYDPAAVPPGPTAVGIALDYTWRRISGTDTGELVLSNIPDDVNLPFDLSLNGTMILNFSGRDGGTYVGTPDADTLDAAEVSGSFYMPDDN